MAADPRIIKAFRCGGRAARYQFADRAWRSGGPSGRQWRRQIDLGQAFVWRASSFSCRAHFRIVRRSASGRSDRYQLRIVNGLIDQGVNAVSLSVLDASSIDPILNKAKDKGTHIFTSDSDAPKSAREVYVAQALDQDLGFTIIDELAKRIGEQGKVGIVSGEATATNLNTWFAFMQQRVKDKYPKIDLLKPQFAGGTAQRAFQIATDLMTANPDLKGVSAVAGSDPGRGGRTKRAS
jgi:ABC-type sugar transport system substrate-binding protein